MYEAPLGGMRKRGRWRGVRFLERKCKGRGRSIYDKEEEEEEDGDDDDSGGDGGGGMEVVEWTWI